MQSLGGISYQMTSVRRRCVAKHTSPNGCIEGASLEKRTERGASQRPPPPPRPPRSPRSRPLPPPPLRPPPPPPPRSVFGRASLTLSVRPPSCDPFRAAMAFSPSSSFVISTNPKPRERPV